MAEWQGRVVGIIHRVKGLKDEPVYLILVDDGDRIWRYESELKSEKQEGETTHETTQSKPT